MPLLSVSHLSVEFHTRNGRLRAVDDVSFVIEPGEILGLVGESGVGKTVTCRALVRLLPGRNGRIASGRIDFAGRDIARLPEEELRHYRGRQIALLFQDPASQLDPILNVGDQLAEIISLQEGVEPAMAERQAAALLEQVGIDDPVRLMAAYPHQLGPGLLRRVAIAQALASSPRLLIADEPTKGLDPGVQAQILRLLLDLRDRRGLAVIMISQDLGVVSQLCDSTAVMYAGRIVERAPKGDLLSRPLHPYSEALAQCLPGVAPASVPLHEIAGEPPATGEVLPGCRFHPRCPHAIERCRFGDVQLVEVSAWRATACLRWEDMWQ
jgi:peptide/nickel transport system ATP-binding protein